jgi:uncharacterized protein involved in exopolysaccharide biosynthesis
MKAKHVVLVLAAMYAIAISGCGRKYTATTTLHVACRPLTNPPRPESEVDAKIRKQREMLVSKSVLTAALRKSEVAALPSVQAQRTDAVQWLGNLLKVERPGKADLIVISCTMNDPREAVVLANAVVDAYIVEVGESEQKLRDRYDDLDLRATKLEKELNEKLQALERIAAASPADKAKTRSTSASQDAVALRAAVDSIKTALRHLTDGRDMAHFTMMEQSRISVVERAQEPKVANRPSL